MAAARAAYLDDLAARLATGTAVSDEREACRAARTPAATGRGFRILRRSKDTGTEHGWLRHESAWGATALPTGLAGPADLAAFTRGRWSVENKSHDFRGMTFGEGADNTCTGHAPANLATCRNLVIGTSEQPATPTSPTPEDAKPTVHDRALTPFDL